MSFGKGCHVDHLGMDFAGVTDEDTWACPYCHIVFKKNTVKKKDLKPTHGSHPHPTH
jgi:hypothetical protein